MAAERWAQRNGFTPDQLTEFGHLMGMVCSTFIAKGKLTALKEIDSGSFGKIYSTTYDGVPGIFPTCCTCRCLQLFLCGSLPLLAVDVTFGIATVQWL